MEGTNNIFEYRESGEPTPDAQHATNDLPFASAVAEPTMLTAAPNVFDAQRAAGWGQPGEAQFFAHIETDTVTAPDEGVAPGVAVPWRKREVTYVTPDPEALAAGINHTAAQIPDPDARQIYEQYAQQTLANIANRLNGN